MKKILVLLLIISLGFTSNDIRVEIITLDWQIITAPELKNSAGIDYTFENAAYPGSPTNMLPVYSQSYSLTAPGQDYRFVIEDPVFREIEVEELPSAVLFPDELEIASERLKSGDLYRIEIQVPAAIERDGKICS